MIEHRPDGSGFWRKASCAPALRRGVVLAVLAFLGACHLGEAPPAPAPEPLPEGPAIREGVGDAEAAREAARILAEGEDLLEEDRADAARERAREVVERFPEAEGSARAFWLEARAARSLEEWSEAEEAARRYMEIFPRGEAEHARAALFRAEVRWEGELGGGIEALFEFPEEAPDEVRADAGAVAAAWAGELETAVLRDLAREAPPHAVVLPPFLVELADRRFLAGDGTEARELAERALSLSPPPDLAARARDIMEGRVAELPADAVLGAILPESGSPSMQELAGAIRDGIEVALVREEAEAPIRVRLRSLDDGGQADGVQQALAELEREGATAVIGPLIEPLVSAAGRARSGPLLILSPTARLLPDGADGVFSLTAIDPEAGRTLARLVRDRGVRDVVLLHTASPEMREEARWFQEAFRAEGGSIVRTLTYSQGTTSFRDPLMEVVRLRPRGLVILAPPDDVELLAPQIAHYGVDDLEDLTIFGSEAWSSRSVLDRVQPRHTDGVYTISSRLEGEGYGPGWDEFVVAYEEHFQRTLRSPMPALGYDAARLLLRALRAGGGDPERTRRALEEIRDHPGASGRLSVVDGRIRRTYFPVRLEARALVSLTP